VHPVETPADVATAMSESVTGFIAELGNVVEEWDRRAVKLREAIPNARRADRGGLVGTAEAQEEMSRTLNIEVGVLIRAWAPYTETSFPSAFEAADKISDLAADMGAHVNDELLDHWNRMRDVTKGAIAESYGKRRRSYERGLEVVEAAIATVANLNIEWSALMLELTERVARMDED